MALLFAVVLLVLVLFKGDCVYYFVGPSGFIKASVGTHSSGVEPSPVLPDLAASHTSADVSPQHSAAGSVAGSVAGSAVSDSMHGSMTQNLPRHRTMSPDAHRLSLDPHVRLKLEKLQVVSLIHTWIDPLRHSSDLHVFVSRGLKWECFKFLSGDCPIMKYFASKIP